ncbi:MAG: hypothetical protein KGL93_07240 [Gemmatimonadota bacterium]|nr:hypothetical protein [Gemmatimonadota bacterium]
MTSRPLAACLAVAMASVAPAARAQAPARLDVVVRPETVTVGQPFTVTLRVRAAAGAAIVLPAAPDTTGWVQPLDPRGIASHVTGDSVDRTATYRLAAWNVGALGVDLADVVMRAGGQERRLPVRGVSVFVKSVLPADSSRRVPKPARPLFVGWTFPWWILAVAALVALVAWLTRRRRRTATPRPPALTPFERAEREFTRVAALGLVEAGERGRYVSLSVEVLRDYLRARFPLASLSLTTGEVLDELRDAPTVPHARLAALLDEADLVKFARRPLAADRALQLGQEARAIVMHEHVASTPASGAEAA